MRTPSFRRLTLLFVLAAVLAAPWPSAAAPRTESVQAAQSVELSPVELFSRVWSFLRDVWSKDGCHIDPDGLCSAGTTQSPSQAKAGCNIDPFGHCKP